MAHWGWYWKYKKKHTAKTLCSALASIDSFQMFKDKDITGFRVKGSSLFAKLLPDGFNVKYGRNKNNAYNIPVEKQPCNYGGFRYFFRCPLCSKRMRFLYSSRGIFVCRKCLNLSYLTQQLRPSSRCLTMASKIKKRLENVAGDIDKKPLRMHRKTFEALKRRHHEYYEIKFGKAMDKEFLEYYPHKAHLLEEYH